MLGFTCHKLYNIHIVRERLTVVFKPLLLRKNTSASVEALDCTRCSGDGRTFPHATRAVEEEVKGVF